MDDVTGDFDVHASNGSVDIARATGTFDIERLATDGLILLRSSSQASTIA